MDTEVDVYQWFHMGGRKSPLLQRPYQMIRYIAQPIDVNYLVITK